MAPLPPLLESILNAAQEGGMDADERSNGNRRNGYIPKQVHPSLGEVTIQTPWDRNSTFEPEFIKKRERILANGVFTNGTALEKLVDLAYRNIRKSRLYPWLTGVKQHNNYPYYTLIGSNYFIPCTIFAFYLLVL